MKYQLKEICSITKGATGIMKATGGKYPLVALSDTRRSHNEFQFDANAVIVPLISSTGHGHASMKRVHYQEGKFALGNILCAVIPNDEKQLNAKYLHLYLQQFKETLLVPLMKGAANVSLPMNKLADVKIEVPGFERQLEIIALGDKAAELKNELEEKLFLQDGDVIKLRQTLLREAMQGKLTKQNLKDGNAKDLLEKIKTEKENLVSERKLKTEIELLPVKEEEIPFEIPDSWLWCRLGEIIKMKYGDGLTKAQCKPDGKIPVYGSNGIVGYYDKFLTNKRTIIIGRKGSAGALNVCKVPSWTTDVSYYIEESSFINFDFEFYLLKSLQLENLGKGIKPGVNRNAAYNLLIPLPPLPEQNRIVKKLEELMKLCDDLQTSIQASKTENEKLLQGALRDALRKEELIVEN